MVSGKNISAVKAGRPSVLRGFCIFCSEQIGKATNDATKRRIGHLGCSVWYGEKDARGADSKLRRGRVMNLVMTGIALSPTGGYRRRQECDCECGDDRLLGMEVDPTWVDAMAWVHMPSFFAAHGRGGFAKRCSAS